MEKYLALILLSAPGFVARRVGKCLGDKPSKRGEFESVLIYFAYSLAALSLTIFIASLIGMITIDQSWSEIESEFSSPIFCAKFMLLSLVCSFVVGTSWCLWIEKAMINGFNYFNKKYDRNPIYLEGSMLHKLFDDNKHHFLVIEKGDKEVAAGYFCGVSSPVSDKTEIYVSIHPELQLKYELARKAGPTHPINIVKGTYIDITNNLVIKELEHPLTWIS